VFGFHYQVAQTDVSSRGLIQKGNSRSSNQGRSKAQSSALPSAHLLSQVECLGCKANRRQQPARLLRQTHLSLLKFPYVCPEAVLVKWSFSALVFKMAGKMRFAHLGNLLIVEADDRTKQLQVFDC
jgi:hypothetical protein